MLQIAIHRQDVFARSVIEAGCQRRRLPKISAQLDHQHAAVHSSNLFQQLVGPVAGAVIDQHQFETLAHLLHYLLQAGI